MEESNIMWKTGRGQNIVPHTHFSNSFIHSNMLPGSPFNIQLVSHGALGIKTWYTIITNKQEITKHSIWYRYKNILSIQIHIYKLIIIIIIINSFYRAQITFKSLSAFRTRIDRHMYKNTQKHEEEKYQTEKHIIKYHSLHNNGNYFTNKWDFNKDLNWSSDEHSLISSGSWFQRWGIEYWKDRWPYDLVTTLCGVNNCLVLDRSNLDGWYSWRSCCK